jgi:hypothetical protein
MTCSVDPWDEVWDAYEARRTATAVASAALPPLPGPQPAAVPQAARRRGWWTPLLASAVFGLGCVAGSAWPVLNLYALVLRQDSPGLLRQLDLSPLRDDLRQALRAQAGLRMPGEQGGAERLLAGMAEDMAQALARPGALEQVVLARGAGAWPSRDPAAPPLRLRTVAWGGTAVELAPPDGPGGFRLDLAWSGGAWQAVGMRLLDPPAAAWPAAPTARPPALQAALPPALQATLPPAPQAALPPPQWPG